MQFVRKLIRVSPWHRPTSCMVVYGLTQAIKQCVTASVCNSSTDFPPLIQLNAQKNTSGAQYILKWLEPE